MTALDREGCYAEHEHEREVMAISAAVEVTLTGRRPKGLFLRTDWFADTMARASSLSDLTRRGCTL